MGYIPLDLFDEMTENRYQAVIVASRRARQLNQIRLAKLEMLSKENADRIEIDGRKVTFRSLQECVEGKIEIKSGNDAEKSSDS
ncbi:MAG: DNA-directed RNA polymerase subunit omega [candidate division Zixibacteria bacterium]|nr:DNA-directed RNA polymerase subunit omega [candidate division Zixibacteria bacterium]